MLILNYFLVKHYLYEIDGIYITIYITIFNNILFT